MEPEVSDSKLRILHVAAKLFMERGYEGVKLKEIAEILDIKQPSLYYHFANGKEQIYVEVVEMEIQQLHKGLSSIIETYQSDNLRDILYNIGSWAEDNMAMSPVIMNKVDMPQLSDDNREKVKFLLFQHIFKPIKSLFDRAIKLDEIREVNTSTLTGMILSILEAMDERINIGPDKQKSWKNSVDILLEGIYHN